MKQWYTIYTKPNAEHKVATVFQERGTQTYLPQIPTTTRTATKPVEKPFFPCYLFARIDFEQVGISKVRWTPGLRRIVSYGDRPTPLADEVIDLLKSKVDQLAAQGGVPAHSFKPGQTVRIKGGPFADMLAIFDGPTTPAKRVQVLLDILGHSSRVHVDVDDLEEVAEQTEAPRPKRPRRSRGRGRPIKNR